MQTNRPLVTIGIPTYNRADGRLGEAINCALSQTYPNIEIIVADNCSSDNTTEFVTGLNNDKIRYIRHDTNIGPINNFNSCLDNANGEYFLLFHDDDAIDPDFIEYCMSSIQGRENIGMIRTGIRIIDADNNVMSESRNNSSGLNTSEFFLSWFKEETVLYIPCTLFNTEKLKGIGGMRSPYDMFCDVFADAKLVAKYDRIDLPEVKASFRRHGKNFGSSSKHVMAWSQDSLALIDLMSELSPEEESRIRKEGMPFLCLKCYHQTRKMDSSFLQRVLMYLKVRKLFSAAYPLWKFFRIHEVRPILGPYKRKILGLYKREISEK